MNVTLDVGGLVVAVTTFLVTVAGCVFWLSRLENKAQSAISAVARIEREREADKVSWGQRLAKAEEGAAAIQGLGKAIEHVAERLSDQITSQAERQQDHNEFVKVQLADIRDEQKRRSTAPPRVYSRRPKVVEKT